MPEIPPMGPPSLFYSSPYPPASLNFSWSCGPFFAWTWVRQGSTPVSLQPREADKSSRRGNTVGTSACGEHGWGRGCDVVSPSKTVVISPLMGEIVWECDCECGNSHKLSLSLSTQLPFVFRLVQSSNRARFRLSI